MKVFNILITYFYALRWRITGDYHGNQCEATKPANVSSYICCVKPKHHAGKHSFER